MKIRVDCGASSIKYKIDDCQNSFPTTIRKLPNISTIKNGNGFEYRGERYLVGLLTDKTEDTSSFDFWVNNLPLLIFKILIDNSIDCSQELFLELSINNIFKDRKETIRESLKEFEVNSQKILFSNIDIFLQGEGFYYAFIKENPSFIGKTIALDDLGSFSDDFCLFENGELTEAISNKSHSVSKLLKRVKPILEARLECELTDAQANRVLITRKALSFGEIVELDGELNALIDTEIRAYVLEYRKHLKESYLSFIKRADKLVICGGGASLIKRSEVEFPNSIIYENLYGNVSW